MELKLFCVDDMEKHWIVSESEEALKRDLFGYYDIDLDSVRSITELPADALFEIYLNDGLDDNEVFPANPYQDDEGRWFVEATVEEWLRVSKRGDMLASTVY